MTKAELRWGVITPLYPAEEVSNVLSDLVQERRVITFIKSILQQAAISELRTCIYFQLLP